MKKWLVLVALLGACSGEGEGEGPGNQAAAGKAGGTGTLSRLTGLYEGGESRPPNQLCIVEGKAEARFGLVVWGSNQHSCSGSGTVSRSGNALRFRMAGDETCSFEARITGTTVTLPASVPDGCAYYCGARASLTGAAFTQAGNSVEDALKARDLVGDPLCTREGG
jgi:hypothetical protein